MFLTLCVHRRILSLLLLMRFFFFFQAEDGIRDVAVTGVQTCALPISGNLLRERRIKAAAALLDERKVETSGARNSLKMIRNAPIGVQRRLGVGLRDCGVLAFREIGHGILESASQVGIVIVAAIARPPGGINGQLPKVRESSSLWHARDLAGR